MKILSREFTRAEKLLIALLMLVLVGLAYYQFVDKPVRASIAKSEAEATAVHAELDVAEARLAQLTAIQGKLDALEATEDLSWMSSYNNAEAEVAFLNNILARTLQYTVNFSDITRTGDQIRRSFSLSFRTPDYESAQAVVSRLCESENRCQVGNVNCTMGKDDTVSMSLTATFYETMVGGVADAGLPKDSAEANQ